MIKTVWLTLLALLAFAGNSVLCRLALIDGSIDAGSFTFIRLLSGIIFLIFFVAIKTKKANHPNTGSWLSAGLLFLYAVAFSYAYISLGTGVGALILFGAVQATMIGYDLNKGKTLSIVQWLGLLLSLSGLFVLLAPGALAPSLTGAALMSIAGIAWGLYSLAGKSSAAPLIDTSSNFFKTLPFIALLVIFNINNMHISERGLLLAITSGAITSGLGYAIWYAAVRRLSATQAAILQLSVPIIATIGGVLFSNEPLTLSLIVSSTLVLGGVFMVIKTKPSIKNTAL